MRGLPYLLYINSTTLAQREVWLNEREWDSHVSFAPLHLSLSPDSRYLLVCTDKHQHLLLKTGTNQRLRILTGHASGDYGKPGNYIRLLLNFSNSIVILLLLVAAWDPSGRYIYCNSEEESLLYVYSIAKERVVERLKGHTGIIRGLSVNPLTGQVATAAYDKSVILWDSNL